MRKRTGAYMAGCGNEICSSLDVLQREHPSVKGPTSLHLCPEDLLILTQDFEPYNLALAATYHLQL
jgi:hypothetical protein